MTVWFTSDLHIGHKLVSGLRWNAMAPDTGVPTVEREEVTPEIISWHDDMLAQNWDDNVGKDDVVWVLGDISAGGTASQRKALDWVDDRPGEKHLIAGNHDGCHPMHKDSHRWQNEYLSVFRSVQAFAQRRISLDAQRHQGVLLSHFPYEGDHFDADRFDAYRLRNEGYTLLHGHVHSPERVTRASGPAPTGYQQARQIHVGVDAWDFKPVNLEEIAEIIRMS